MNKIFQEYFSDNPVFSLGYSEIYLQNFQKTTSKKSNFKIILNLSAKSLKNTYKEICILESFSVSMKKIFEIRL